MRNTLKDKRIFGATRDYFNDRGGRTDLIAYHITGRKHLKDLTEEEKSDVWKIRNNIGDKVYTENLLLKCV